MDRRQFVAVATTAGFVGLTGCLRGGDATDGEQEGAENEQEETESDTEGGMRVFDPPDARFSIELPGLDDPRTFTITHDGGESIEARELFVRGNGITEGYTGAFHEIPDSGFEADDDVSPGDSLDVTVQDEDDAYVITVEWVSAETGDSTVYTEASRGAMQSG